MKMRFAWFIMIAVVVFACNNGADKKKAEEQPLTEVQKIAKDLCGCLGEMAWKKIESNPQDNQVVNPEMMKFFTCSMALRSKYDVDVMDGNEVTAEMDVRCPDLQKKIQKLKEQKGGNLLN